MFLLFLYIGIPFLLICVFPLLATFLLVSNFNPKNINQVIEGLSNENQQELSNELKLYVSLNGYRIPRAGTHNSKKLKTIFKKIIKTKNLESVFLRKFQRKLKIMKVLEFSSFFFAIILILFLVIGLFIVR